MPLFARSRQKRGWSRWAILRHFWIRGGVLIALQLLIVNRAWELSPEGWGLEIYIGVLFALGGNMILGSLLLLAAVAIAGIWLLLAACYSSGPVTSRRHLAPDRGWSVVRG